MSANFNRFPAIDVCRRISLGLLFAGACVLLPGCSRQPADDGQKKVDPISQTEPRIERLPEAAPVVANATAVPSRGDCAPRYKNGLTGSCINGQPCRGFGVLDETKKEACACYGRAGGCGQNERCDAIKKACVPEEEVGFGRAQ
jgi:hypothetical protein